MRMVAERRSFSLFWGNSVSVRVKMIVLDHPEILELLLHSQSLVSAPWGNEGLFGPACLKGRFIDIFARRPGLLPHTAPQWPGSVSLFLAKLNRPTELLSATSKFNGQHFHEATASR